MANQVGLSTLTDPPSPGSGLVGRQQEVVVTRVGVPCGFVRWEVDASPALGRSIQDGGDIGIPWEQLHGSSNVATLGVAGRHEKDYPLVH